MPTERPASWTPAHPALLRLLDAAIEAAGTTPRPSANVAALRRVRRHLVRMDNGHQPYLDSPLGHPAVGTVLRLAADIADHPGRLGDPVAAWRELAAGRPRLLVGRASCAATARSKLSNTIRRLRSAIPSSCATPRPSRARIRPPPGLDGRRGGLFVSSQLLRV